MPEKERVLAAHSGVGELPREGVRTGAGVAVSYWNCLMRFATEPAERRGTLRGVGLESVDMLSWARSEVRNGAETEREFSTAEVSLGEATGL